MKYLLLTMFFLAGTICRLTAQPIKSLGVFIDTLHDFGRLPDSLGVVRHVFTFRNTGKVPLIVQNCRGSGGGQVPDWSREPVMPGKTGQVAVMMHITGRDGVFNKTVDVQFNTGIAQTLYIRGDVYHVDLAKVMPAVR